MATPKNNKIKSKKPLKRKPNARRIVSAVVAIIIAAVAATGIGLSYWATDGYTISASDVLISVDGGNNISADSDAAKTIELPLNQSVRIDVTAGLAKLGGTSEYNVAVAPKSGVNFDFKINGELVGFRGVGDVTSIFITATESGYFVVNTTVRPIAAVLQNYYIGKTVTDVPEDLDISAYFALTLTAGGKTITIDLTGVVVPKLDVSGVTLDNPTINF
jgi:hypothetical protein